MLFEARAYLRHLISAKGPHGVHSPMVFDLITKILIQDKSFYVFEAIERVREDLLRDERMIHVQDFGAGSRKMKGDQRSVAHIAKFALQPASHAQALFRLIDYVRPENILELGTSLGITSAYLASVAAKTKVWTLEGAPEIARIAKEVFDVLNLGNVKVIQGNFDDQLNMVLQEMGNVDVAVMDGNHRYDPTIRYFNEISPFLHDDSVVILDDIHWSAEMERAWNEISRNPKVTLSLDFFHFGVLFFRKGRVIEHFRLKLP